VQCCAEAFSYSSQVFLGKGLIFPNFVVYYWLKAVLTDSILNTMSGVRKFHTLLFTLSAAESVILVLLLITLFGAVVVRVVQRTSPLGEGVVIRAVGGALRHRIELNTASEEELTLIPGIAAARARKIVEYRRKHGGFGVIDELVDINGFSKTLVNRLRKYLYIRSSAQRYVE